MIGCIGVAAKNRASGRWTLPTAAANYKMARNICGLNQSPLDNEGHKRRPVSSEPKR